MTTNQNKDNSQEKVVKAQTEAHREDDQQEILDPELDTEEATDEVITPEAPSVIISPQLRDKASQLASINAATIDNLDDESIRSSLLSTASVVKELLNIVENNIQVKMTDSQSKDQIAKLKEEVARRTAEIENTRIRITKNMEDRIKYATTPILKDLIPTIENLDAALQHAPQNSEDSAIKNFIMGVELTHKKFLETLNQHNIEQLGKEGEKFDPNFHDAVAQVPSDKPEGEIISVHRKGYRLADRVITPAQVVISQSKDI